METQFQVRTAVLAGTSHTTATSVRRANISDLQLASLDRSHKIEPNHLERVQCYAHCHGHWHSYDTQTTTGHRQVAAAGPMGHTPSKIKRILPYSITNKVSGVKGVKLD